MLVLTRGQQEVIQVGDDIAIVVVSFPHTRKVRLGIVAPKDVAISRREGPREPESTVFIPEDRRKTRANYPS
jgi:carbon storage regulator CsrA